MDGFVNVLKPPGMTSHDVVARLRRVFRGRAGHLGTLDPMARGVLPVAMGSCTRLAEYFLQEDKEYLSEFVFGLSTDTGDLDGQITGQVAAEHLSPEKVRMALLSMTGSLHQVPPAYSALKIRGRKMYEMARQGVDPDHPGRWVQVFRFQMLGWIPGPQPRGIFRARVGRGTYIRSLATSLGQMMGTGASVSYLLRTRVGKFSLQESHPLSWLERAPDEMRNELVISDLSQVMPDMPEFYVREESIRKVVHGVPLSLDDFVAPEDVTGLSTPFLVFGRVKGSVRLVAVAHPGRIKDAAPPGSLRFKYDKVLIRQSDVH